MGQLETCYNQKQKIGLPATNQERSALENYILMELTTTF